MHVGPNSESHGDGDRTCCCRLFRWEGCAVTQHVQACCDRTRGKHLCCSIFTPLAVVPEQQPRLLLHMASRMC